MRLIFLCCMLFMLTIEGCAQDIERNEISICSFNVQFLGNFKNRNDSALTEIIKNYDVVLIQELVAPPNAGIFPNGEAFDADAEAKSFVDFMKRNGFAYKLSEEDTGTGEEIHKNSAATEWWIAFFKPEKLKYDQTLPNGFLASDRSNHPDYERVPYAFSFKTVDENFDFVLISVHLKPDKNGFNRRKQELNAIYKWIEIADSIEKDFFILGDMNIYNKEELDSLLLPQYQSLNDFCGITTTNLNGGGKPYDHVFYRPEFSANEINKELSIINLVDTMKYFWKDSIPYPGEPYHHNAFRTVFSDHNPIVFFLEYTSDSD